MATALRSVASVTVNFGMVSIPVKVFVATEESAIKFNLLHKGCNSRLKQQYICQKEGVVVEREDMCKGFEFSKDQYVVFEKEELDQLAEEATRIIQIAEFVPAASIDPIYYDKAYFVAPDKGGIKAYSLLCASMRKSGQTAVGRYAARGKQYIVQLRPVDGGIVMQQLLYAPEVRSIRDLTIEEFPVNAAELSLALQLVKAISSEKFNAEKYEDSVAKRIEEAVAQKAGGKNIVIAQPATQEKQVVDIVEALKKSLAAHQPAAQPTKQKAKRKAA